QTAAAMPIAAEVEGLEALQDRLLRRLLEGEPHAGPFDQGDGPVIAGKEREVARRRDLGDAEAPEEIALSGLARDLPGHALAVLPGHGPIIRRANPHLVPNSRSPASPSPGRI